MNLRTLITTALTAASLIVLPGCAVTRDQEPIGAYIDDSAITAAVKAKFVSSEAVDAAAISVETLNGTVLLSGFAKNHAEKVTAEALARECEGVKSVKNAITVRS